MSPHDDSVGEMIPWYANGTASAEERLRVEQHLPACPACRALLDEALELRGRGVDEGDLAGHPPAALLVRLTERPDGLDPKVRTRLEAHLMECTACRSATEAAAELAAAGLPGRRAAGGGLWSWMGRTFLSPGMALAYILILAVGLGWLATLGPLAPVPAPQPGGEAGAGGSGPAIDPAGPSVLPPAISAPGEMSFREAPAEDGTPTLLVSLPASPGASVHLRLETDIDPEDLADPAATFEIRLVQGGGAVWSRIVPGGVFTPMGAIGLLVPPSILRSAPVTRVEILLHRRADPMDGKPLYIKHIGVR